MPDGESATLLGSGWRLAKVSVVIAIASAGVVVMGAGKSEAATRTVSLGPAFDCTAARQPLAQMLCTDPELARLDLRFGQAYWGLYQQVGKEGQRALKEEDAAFLNAVQQQCLIPKSGPLTPEALQGRDCVKQSYENQRTAWLSRLRGPASEEAGRDPERHIALQATLRTLGFIAPADMIDGVYGPNTRTAIATWQRTHNRPPTGFLGDDDALLVERDVAERSSMGAAAASKPVGATGAGVPNSPPPGEGLSVTVMPERTDTALVIKGEIRNEADGSRDVPKLRVAIRDAGETELAMKVVNAPVDQLNAGATATFETSFDLSDQATGVAVTFLAGATKPLAAERAPPDAKTQINALLADIYSHYPRNAGRNVPPPWRMPYAAEVFDPPMVALLVEEHRLASGPDGGIVAFDADPFCDCQDDEGMRPTVGDINVTSPTTATAQIDLRWMCAVSQSPRLSPADRQKLMSDCWRQHKDGLVDSKHLVMDLVIINGAWRIHDIRSPNIRSLRDHVTEAIASVQQVPKKQ